MSSPLQSSRWQSLPSPPPPQQQLQPRIYSHAEGRWRGSRWSDGPRPPPPGDRKHTPYRRLGLAKKPKKTKKPDKVAGGTKDPGKSTIKTKSDRKIEKQKRKAARGR